MKKLIMILTVIFITSSITIASAANYQGKKVLFIDSYHSGYDWSDGVTSGVQEVFQDSGIKLKIHRMDTKRNRSEEFKKEAAQKAKAVIESFKPDLVIASDDNAAKYLIEPYYKNSELPIIFCGLNWDASIYGFPTANITGMVEIELLAPLIKQLRKYAKGDRIGYLGLHTLTAQKIVENHTKLLDVKYHKVYFVENFSQWQEKFLRFQKEVDILFIGNPLGMADWNEDAFIHFARKHTMIPTGATASWRMPYTLLGYLRIPEEQGRWAAQTTLRILAGEKPSAIPVVSNKEGKLVINQAISEKLGITFSSTLFKRAEIIRP
jgi:ABC-type uncharacterized transport system substrate-binding protein